MSDSISLWLAGFYVSLLDECLTGIRSRQWTSGDRY